MSSLRSEYTIGGVKILFPCKAYPSQLAMMNSIVRGLNCKQHCLLESPTGSGKSLALLCSALAWQQAQYEKPVDEDKDKKDWKKEEAVPCGCTCHSKIPNSCVASTSTSLSNAGPSSSEFSSNTDASRSKPTLASKLSAKKASFASDEEDNDFQMDRKRIRQSPLQQQTRKRRCFEKGVQFIDDDDDTNECYGASSSCQQERVDSANCRGESSESTAQQYHLYWSGRYEKTKELKLILSHILLATIAVKTGRCIV